MGSEAHEESCSTHTGADMRRCCLQDGWHNETLKGLRQVCRSARCETSPDKSDSLGMQHPPWRCAARLARSFGPLLLLLHSKPTVTCKPNPSLCSEQRSLESLTALDPLIHVQARLGEASDKIRTRSMKVPFEQDCLTVSYCHTHAAHKARVQSFCVCRQCRRISLQERDNRPRVRTQACT